MLTTNVKLKKGEYSSILRRVSYAMFVRKGKRFLKKESGVNALKQLILIKNKDKEKAADTLAKAFMNDPLSCWFFEDEETRYSYLLDYFNFRVSYGMRYGEVYATSYRYEGIAIWLPGEKAEVTNWRGMRSGGMKLYNKISSDIMTQFNQVGHYTTEFRNNLIQPPYYQLSPIGVKPEFQGKGFGSKLLKPMLERFDEEEITCFLETQTESNLPIYEKLGFKIIKEGKIPKANLSHWGMIRKPK